MDNNIVTRIASVVLLTTIIIMLHRTLITGFLNTLTPHPGFLFLRSQISTIQELRLVTTATHIITAIHLQHTTVSQRMIILCYKALSPNHHLQAKQSSKITMLPMPKANSSSSSSNSNNNKIRVTVTVKFYLLYHLMHYSIIQSRFPSDLIHML